MSASERRIEQLEGELKAALFELEKTRHLLKRQLRTGEALEFEAIVSSEDGVGRVQLRWDDLGAQLSVEVARSLFIAGLRVAEWAEVDATAFRAVREAFDEETAAGILVLLRRARGQDPGQASGVRMEVGK